MINDLHTLRERRSAVVERAKRRGAAHLNDAEQADFERLSEQIEDAERRADLRNGASRLFNAAQAKTGQSMTSYRVESEIYNERAGHDFMRDLLHNAIPGGSVEARRRVAAYQEEQEQRLTGMSIATDAAGSFTVPAYLEDLYARGLHPALPVF
jgi:hypothetical protein